MGAFSAYTGENENGCLQTWIAYEKIKYNSRIALGEYGFYLDGIKVEFFAITMIEGFLIVTT